jgi:hypothetical protein
LDASLDWQAIEQNAVFYKVLVSSISYVLFTTYIVRKSLFAVQANVEFHYNNNDKRKKERKEEYTGRCEYSTPGTNG